MLHDVASCSPCSSSFADDRPHRSPPPLDPAEVWRALVSGQLEMVRVRIEDGRYHALVGPVRAAPEVSSRRLSQREREVVARVAEGCSNKLIAYELGVATSTVARLVSRAMDKLGVRNRVELIRKVRGLAAR
jgi:DNA-binding NarL/FixJ family response regulator